ncbi:MAG: MBOAT family protein [Bacteroidota bacterium]
MLFNSAEFIFCFLPIVLFGYFVLNHYDQPKQAKIWLFLASLFFYGWWNPWYLPIILGSMLVNFQIGKLVSNLILTKWKRIFVTIGIIANVLLLVFFKYTDFLIENTNGLLSTDFNLLHIALPLAISFFTFQQIAYLCDSYKGLTGSYTFFNYGLFVSFFPQLIAGPIVHHTEMMPQFFNKKSNYFNHENASKGIYMFFMGFGKKVIIADTFAAIANAGYANTGELSLIDGWVTSLAYAIQLYFDFSGYTDMAIGAALMFNINLPLNFNSPYKALSIQDFWRRWHMTLSRFLRDYIYIPLGGNRNGELKTLTNLMITFIIGGIWHGAGWTFVFWGFMHGAGLIIHRLWQKSGVKMPSILALFITFNFVNVAWVFFRATSWQDAINVLHAMIGMNAASGLTVISDFYSLPILILGVILLFGKNTNERLAEFKPDMRHAVAATAMIVLGVIYINSITASEFLYFDF